MVELMGKVVSLPQQNFNIMTDEEIRARIANASDKVEEFKSTIRQTVTESRKGLSESLDDLRESGYSRSTLLQNEIGDLTPEYADHLMNQYIKEEKERNNLYMDRHYKRVIKEFDEMLYQFICELFPEITDETERRSVKWMLQDEYGFRIQEERYRYRQYGRYYKENKEDFVTKDIEHINKHHII